MGKFSIRYGLLFLCIVYGGIVRAQNGEPKIQLSAATGYQNENFHWSIAGNVNGQNPNIYSELKWKAIKGPLYSLALQWNVWDHFLLLADYDKSFIRSGTSNDTDYSGDNRTGPVYNQSFDSNKGSTSAWSTGVGYLLFKNKLWSLSPYLGYGINYQTYYLLGNEGDFGQLNTSYKTQWQGLFFKIKPTFNISDRLEIVADLTYNQVKYSAAADWNLIETFQHPVSFRHSADGYGIDADAKLAFKINRYFSANLGAAFFNWETGNGTDQLYLTTGETDKTQLNEVIRNGFRVEVGLSVLLGGN
ncbi:hypothetical protein ACPPVU_04160 [Mucilaginibacter sp. McL0603]|uniref:hypothetical protein n=1 Tax=Mucilaginibacter sp. McL0603 TaxID=3415670 RepID=UPI003CEB9970